MKLISAMTEINDHRLVAFGGTQDEDEDDELQSEFLDEMNFYDTKTSRWFPAVVKSKGFKIKFRFQSIATMPYFRF